MRSFPTLFLSMVAAAPAQVTTYTSLSTYSNATAGTSVIGFNNILPAGTPYSGFNPGAVSGVAFTLPTSFNVNTAAYYSGADYPADYLLATDQTYGSDSLTIVFPTLALAVALDHGQLFGGNPATIELSNGYCLADGEALLAEPRNGS